MKFMQRQPKFFGVKKTVKFLIIFAIETRFVKLFVQKIINVQDAFNKTHYQ